MICYGCVKYTLQKVKKGYENIFSKERNLRDNEQDRDLVRNNLGKMIDDLYSAKTPEEEEAIIKRGRNFLKELERKTDEENSKNRF
ncbi:MAG: hypothetical protein ACOC3Z_00100 [Nanoarchaeota archaeon]